MAARRREEPVEVVSYEEQYAQLAREMSSLHLSRISEMPRVELYLDQVLSIITSELAPLYAPGEKIVTGAMVNNYVKQHVIPAPVKRRYTRRQLAGLLFVCTFKRVLPIAQVAQLLSMCRDASLDEHAAYDELAGALEQTLAQYFPEQPGGPGPLAIPQLRLHDGAGDEVGGALPSLLGHAIGLVANNVYVEKLLAIEEGRRRAEADAGTGRG